MRRIQILFSLLAVLVLGANWIAQGQETVNGEGVWEARLSVGQGTTGYWAGPFQRVAEQRFAMEGTSLLLTWNDESLNAIFKCEEECLNPINNRLHEFQKDNESIWSNDYVILLFERGGVFYDVIVDGSGRIETAISTDANFWAGRKVRQDTGVAAVVQIGNGNWIASIRIPWEAIGGKAKLGEQFRFQAGRGNASIKEKSVLFPCMPGFHAQDFFSVLKLVKQVPEVRAELPAFLPGKNVIACENASISGRIEQSGQPTQVFDSGEFDLQCSGKFKIGWRLFGPETEPYWISPLYDMTASAVALKFSEENTLRLNGKDVVSGAFLRDGKNVIEVNKPFQGRMRAGDWEFVPPASQFQLYTQHTLLWPNWQEQEWCVTRGGLQQLLFAPRGFPDATVSDYTIKLSLPEGFKLECASGYYSVYPSVRFTPDGTITIDKEISYRKTIPSHEFIAAFIRVPEDFEGDVTELSFASSSPSQNIMEVPQKVKVRVLPKLDGVAPKDMLIYIWAGGLHALTNKAYIETVLKDFANAGINLIVNLPNKVIPYNYSFFINEDWSWPVSPYLQVHPEAVLIQKDGTPNKRFVCPQSVRTPEFAAWLRTQVPFWLERGGNPEIVEWDYEFNVENGPFSCYCPKCTGHTDMATRHQDMVFYLKLLRDALREVNPNIRMSVYSGYQTEQNKKIYGIDWSLLKDVIDIAECGYGRPVEAIKATYEAIGDMPLVLGAIVAPYEYSDRQYPTQYTPAWLVRRAVDSTYGILLYNYPSFDGKSMHAIAEASKIMSRYEEFFRFGKRMEENVPDWPKDDVQTIEYNGKRILILMNSSLNTRHYLGRSVPAGDCQVIEL